MAIPILKLISDLWKPKPRHVPERRHLMLAGITQSVFVKQWGSPEIQINLDQLRGFYQQGSMALNTSAGINDPHSVWIYTKHDKICFFTNRRLVSHFKWSAFKDKRNIVMNKADLRSARISPRPAALAAQALAMGA
jgi:hypothetical protein